MGNIAPDWNWIVFDPEGDEMRVSILLAVMLLLTSIAPIASCQLTNESAAERLNRLVDNDKGDLINSTQELVMIKSVNGDPKTGAPFGEGPAQALEKVLVIAVYAKNDKANLSPAERNEVKRILELFWKQEAGAAGKR